MLEHPRALRHEGAVSADRATFHLTHDNHVENVVAQGNVKADVRVPATRDSRSRRKTATGSPEEIHGNAEEAEFLFVPDEDVLRTATLRGKVHLEQTGDQPLVADAGRVVLNFGGNNQLQTVRALDGAHLKQTGSDFRTQASGSAQDFELTAPVIDFRWQKTRLAARQYLGAATDHHCAAECIGFNFIASAGSYRRKI